MLLSTDMKKIISVIFFICFSVFLFANTPIKSIEEEYYDFLVLTGRAERSFLTHRTLDNNYYSNDNGFWNLSDNKKGNFTIYGPDFFSSYNYQRPYGQNDGALWQGVGVNAQLKAGVNYSFKGFSFTFKPEFDFSQNKEYPTIHDTYSYYWGNLDKPQRFGDKPVYSFDFGDSEIRYTYKGFTIGFGTQSLWLGPNYLNAIIHSNNAPTYPRFEIGLKKSQFSFGNLEAFYSVGILKKSDYAIGSKDNTALHVVSLAWQPWFMPSFTLGGNLVANQSFDQELWELYYRILFHNSYNRDEDIKVSLTADFLLPESGFEGYAEIGWDDLSSNLIANCFHTLVYQVGFKKSIDINPQRNIYGELVGEFGNMEMSRDGFAQWSYNFYTHHAKTNSYTNKGQILGAGTGYAGNSQYLAFNVFYPKGLSTLFIQRSNPDNNYIFWKVNGVNTNCQYYHDFKGILDVGLKTAYIGFDNFELSASAVYELIMADMYKENLEEKVFYDMTHNFHIAIGAKYSF